MMQTKTITFYCTNDGKWFEGSGIGKPLAVTVAKLYADGWKIEFSMGSTPAKNKKGNYQTIVFVKENV